MTTTRRVPISKGLRFEIFKRDGFKCLYCGATPVQRALHVDHVKPVAEGGTNDPSNLVTACEACNLGKGAVPLDRKKFADTSASEAQLEQVEQIRAYLQLQEELQGARQQLVDQLLRRWRSHGLAVPETLDNRLPFMVEQVGLDRVYRAIDIVAAKARTRRNQGQPWGPTDALMYLNGVIRGMREGR